MIVYSKKPPEVAVHYSLPGVLCTLKPDKDHPAKYELVARKFGPLAPDSPVVPWELRHMLFVVSTVKPLTVSEFNEAFSEAEKLPCQRDALRFVFGLAKDCPHALSFGKLLAIYHDHTPIDDNRILVFHPCAMTPLD